MTSDVNATHLPEPDGSNRDRASTAINVTVEDSTAANVAAAADPRDTDLAKIEVAVQAIIFLLAVFSNGLVLLALVRQLRRKPMSRMYRLMYHLSIADLLVAMFNILPQLIWDITFRFQGPDLLCRAVKFGQVFPIYLSSFILTLMAVDRVGVTGGGSSHARSGRKARRRLASSMSSATSLFGIGQDHRLPLLVRIAWLAAAVLSVPQVFIFSMTTVDKAGVTMDCWATFGGQTAEKVYVIFFLTVVFFLPFVVITASYAIVTQRIWRYSKNAEASFGAAAAADGSPADVCGFVSSSSNNAGHAADVAEGNDDDDDDDDVNTMETGAEYEMKVFSHSNHGNGNSKPKTEPPNPFPPSALLSSSSTTRPPPSNQIVLLSRAKKKSLAMTAVVCVCFAVCWLPWCVTMMLLTFGINVAGAGNDVHPILVILALLASLNSTTNPWIYMCFSSAMLQQVKHIIGLHSTFGGGDSLGDADRPPAPAPGLAGGGGGNDGGGGGGNGEGHHLVARRILFRNRDDDGRAPAAAAPQAPQQHQGGSGAPGHHQRQRQRIMLTGQR